LKINKTRDKIYVRLKYRTIDRHNERKIKKREDWKIAFGERDECIDFNQLRDWTEKILTALYWTDVPTFDKSFFDRISLKKLDKWNSSYIKTKLIAFKFLRTCFSTQTNLANLFSIFGNGITRLYKICHKKTKILWIESNLKVPK
jgi:hypothetical protein